MKWNFLAIIFWAMLCIPCLAAAESEQDFILCVNPSAGSVVCDTAGANLGVGKRTRVFIHNDTNCSGAPSVVIQGRDEETEMWHTILTLDPAGVTSRDDITAFHWMRATDVVDVGACTGFTIIARTRWNK